MRLALAAALLTVCLCGQGCLSFVFLGSSDDPYAVNRKVSCLITGIIGGALLTAGGGFVAWGDQEDRIQDDEWEDDLNSYPSRGWGKKTFGGILISAGVVPALISFIHGISHLAARLQHGNGGEAPKRRRYERQWGSRAFGPVPHEPPGQPVVGLPELGHIDPKKLPIQKVNWYWIQQE
jgi:hypothetical protein